MCPRVLAGVSLALVPPTLQELLLASPPTAQLGLCALLSRAFGAAAEALLRTTAGAAQPPVAERPLRRAAAAAGGASACGRYSLRPREQERPQGGVYVALAALGGAHGRIPGGLGRSSSPPRDVDRVAARRPVKSSERLRRGSLMWDPLPTTRIRF
jgi:hypothetical protein